MVINSVVSGSIRNTGASSSNFNSSASKKRRVVREDWERKVHGELEQSDDDSTIKKKLSPISPEYDKEGHLVHHATRHKRGSVCDVIGDGLEAWEVRERSRSSGGQGTFETMAINANDTNDDDVNGGVDGGVDAAAVVAALSPNGHHKTEDFEGEEEKDDQDEQQQQQGAPSRSKDKQKGLLVSKNEVDSRLKLLQQQEADKYKSLLNFNPISGYYEIIFENAKLGIGLSAAVSSGDLPIVTAAPDQSHNKPFGDRLCKVGGVDLKGNEDTYEEAVKLIKSAGRPLVLGFIPLRSTRSFQSELGTRPNNCEYRVYLNILNIYSF
jgi:hypothetical protein